MKDKLINMDLITFSKYIKDSKNNSSLINFEEFSKHYKDYKITNRQLHELREDFFIEQLRKKLESNEAEWETDQTDYVNNYKKDLEEHLTNFRAIIEQLEDEISKINIEHERKNKKYSEKLKKVNEIKMKLEAQIEVKTGYESVLKRFSTNTNSININLNTNKEMDENANKDSKENKKFKFKFITGKNTSEYEKLKKKVQGLTKDIDISNKALFEEYKKLDKKKISLEKVTKTKEKLKKQLNDIIQNSEKIKRELLKNLSEKLKLTAKFVSTNTY
jgi:chromosome segregation ATPase